MTFSGGCACASVRYSIKETPLFTHACHCLDCQRTSGSAFVINIVSARDQLDITGETKMIVLPTGSGAGNELHYCAQCGTYIWCHNRYHQVRVIATRGGTLDDPSNVTPQAHIFVQSKQPWVEIPNAVPAYAKAYTRDEAWPRESVERYEALPRIVTN